MQALTHVFYHADMDGLATLYAHYHLCNKRIIAKPIQYGDLSCFEDVEAEDNVVFLDFCPDRAIMEHIQPYGSVMFVDHHSGAKEKVEYARQCPAVNYVYDPDAHGACQLLYSALGKEAPEVIKLVGDRDVWCLDDPRTEQLHEFFMSLDIPVDTWGKWFDRFDWLLEPANLAHACKVGEGLVKERDERVAAKAKEAKLYRISGITEPVLGVEASDDISVLGNALAGVAGLGMVFRVVGNAVVISFRSKDGHSALEAAKALGGGGHGNAAGATVGRWMIEGAV